MRRIVERRVISLAGSPRLEGFMAQPDASGFRVWEAFDGRAGAGAELFDDATYVARVGQAIRPGEIGCAMSHLQLMQHFGSDQGADDDVLLVSEDDVLFSTDFSAVAQRLLERSNFGWVLMANGFEEPGRSPFWSKNRDRVALSWFSVVVGPPERPMAYRAGRYEGDLWCTGLYMVTRTAARQLASYAAREGRISWRADDYAVWHRPAGVDVHMLRPSVAGFIGESEIHLTDRAHLNEGQYVASRLGRQAWQRRARRARMGLAATTRSVGHRDVGADDHSRIYLGAKF